MTSEEEARKITESINETVARLIEPKVVNQHHEPAPPEKACFICQDCQEEGPLEGSPLVATGCLCRGTAGYVHVSPCLVEAAWANEQSCMRGQERVYHDWWLTYMICYPIYSDPKVVVQLAFERWNKVKELPYMSDHNRSAILSLATELENEAAEKCFRLLLEYHEPEISRDVPSTVTSWMSKVEIQSLSSQITSFLQSTRLF